MGSMGQRRIKGRNERGKSKRGRGRGEDKVLGWFPDGRRPNNARTKKLADSWLKLSFHMGNIDATTSWMIKDDRVDDLKTAIQSVVDAVSDDDAGTVKIQRPETSYPYWTASMSMVVSGVLLEADIESLDLNEVMDNAIVWVNQQAIR